MYNWWKDGKKNTWINFSHDDGGDDVEDVIYDSHICFFLKYELQKYDIVVSK